MKKDINISINTIPVIVIITKCRDDKINENTIQFAFVFHKIGINFHGIFVSKRKSKVIDTNRIVATLRMKNKMNNTFSSCAQFRSVVLQNLLQYTESVLPYLFSSLDTHRHLTDRQHEGQKQHHRISKSRSSTFLIINLN